MTTLYLASQSPRRAELLRQIGVTFVCIVPGVDEQRTAGEGPAQYVKRLAAQKAQAGMALIAAENPLAASVVLGADTIVVKGEHIFGKPANQADFIGMISALSGTEHSVLTAVEILRCEPAVDGQAVMRRFSVLSSTKVVFKPLLPGEVEAYWHSGEPLDKAGGYAIQGAGALLVESIHGSYSGVVGLPLFETGQLLARAGIASALLGQSNQAP